MFVELRKSVVARVEIALESAGFLLSLFGASLAAAFGRFLVAVLLAALALGVGLRLVGRQRPAATSRPKVPWWVKASSMVLSIVEVAVVVEATDTPDRFHREGFSYAPWVLVLIAIVVAYLIQVRAIAAISRRALKPAP